MARTKNRRNRWILLVVMAMVLATVGVVYAHWTSTLGIQGQVNTGGVQMNWQQVFTNDDGVFDGEWDEVFDFWGESSSADPANFDGSERYDKDVAGCWAGGGGDWIDFHIDNAYPSYHCMVSALAFNEASVPVRATFLDLTPSGSFCYFPDFEHFNWVGDENPPFEWLDDPSDDDGYEGDGVGPWIFDEGDDFAISDEGEGPFIEPEGRVYMECEETFRDDYDLVPTGDGTFEIQYDPGDGAVTELTMNITDGIYCGTQIDPGEGVWTNGWIHVEQDARQNFNYEFRLTQGFVNWNEFSYEFCTEGTVAANADGEPIGINNGTSEPDLFPPPD